MRVLNVLGAGVVLVCALVVSFNHSIQLFKAGGFGELAVWGVVGVETTFLLGALNLVVSRMKHQSPGWPAYAGGVLGAILVGWSNIAAGMPYGWTGVLLGAAMPVSLFVAEAILSRAILNQQRAANQLETPPAEEEPPATRPEELVETPPAATNHQLEEAPSAPPATTSREDMVETPPATTNHQPAKTTTQVEKKETSPPTTNQAEKSDPVAVALEILEKEGELPGRPRLMKESGCSDWKARKALKELRQRKAG